MFTHAPPQLIPPLLHVGTQAPDAHVSPGAQALPHAPQFAGSSSRSTHVLPQLLRAPTQVSTHAPSEHVSHGSQAWPQLPQLAVSSAVSTQAPPHSVVMAGH